MMKKTGKIAALLAAGALLFGGLFLSCSDDDGGDGNTDSKQEGVVDNSDTGSGSEKANEDDSTGDTGTVAWTVSGNTITPSATTKSTISAFDVSDATSVTVSLKTTIAAGTDDWTTKILTTADNYIITIPNLDPWNNTEEGSTLAEKNAFPSSEGATVGEGLDYNSDQTGSEVAITIALNKSDSTIVFTLNGATWVTYGSTIWDGAISTFIGKFYDALTAGTLIFNEGDLTISEASITKTVAGDTPSSVNFTADFLALTDGKAVSADSYIGNTDKTPALSLDLTTFPSDTVPLIFNASAKNGMRLRKDTNNINYNGGTTATFATTSVGETLSETLDRYVGIDTSKLASSGNLKVTFSILAKNSSSATADSGIVVLLDNADNKILAVHDSVALKTGNDTFDIEATVAAGTKVIAGFSRGGAGAGGIDITGITVVTAN